MRILAVPREAESNHPNGAAPRGGRSGPTGGLPPGSVSLPPDAARAALAALAQLDAAAAAAYEIGAARIGDAEVAAVLEAYRADHLRHVAELDRLAAGRGAARAGTGAGDALLSTLAAALAPIGDDALLLTLLANEELTNTSYEAALAIAADDETRALLERHAQDERRHFEWLHARADELLRGDGDDIPDGEEEELPATD